MKNTINRYSFLILLVLIGCEKDDKNDENIIYDTPFSISPPNGSIFYSHEQFVITWELPEGLNNTQIQILESSNPINTGDNSVFNNLPIQGYGGQTSHIFSYIENPENPINETIYIGYRLRAYDLELETGYSEWTEIRTFTIAPLTSFDKVLVDVHYDFDILTEEVGHEYYSGVTEKFNFNLSNIAVKNNLDINKIKVVRPVNVEASFLTLNNDGQNPFYTLTFGYNDSPEQNTSVYPFNPLGQVFPGSIEESPIQSQLYNQQYINLNNDLRTYNLKMAYLLNDEPGTQHQLQLHFKLHLYLEE